jgi:hypothetical protein
MVVGVSLDYLWIKCRRLGPAATLAATRAAVSASSFPGRLKLHVHGLCCLGLDFINDDSVSC